MAVEEQGTPDPLRPAAHESQGVAPAVTPTLVAGDEGLDPPPSAVKAFLGLFVCRCGAASVDRYGALSLIAVEWRVDSDTI